VVGGAVAPLLIKRASTDLRFAQHPAHKLRRIESYIAVPLMRRDGSYFGTLCALDTLPAELGEQHLELISLLAKLIGFELEADESQQRREAELAQARDTAAAREQFIAVLGHELRNPLGAIKGFANLMLRREALSERGQADLSRIMEGADRMNRLIADLLDFTRGRLGAGIPLDPTLTDLGAICRQCIEELNSGHPGRPIKLRVEGDTRGRWDQIRLGQVVSNLLTNAVRYSPAETPVDVAVRPEDGFVVLEVHNEGRPIPPEMIELIFDPFRRNVRPSGDEVAGDGLGLGLYIVQQIVQAHRGTVRVCSSEREGTTFALRLPRRPDDQQQYSK
jgi:signal transduction histidine kinase